MAKIAFRTMLKKFGEQGEKTGWTFIEVDAEQAAVLKPGTKKSFRVKGRVDHYKIEKTALLPIGNGKFIMPLNATVRKAIGKKKGDTVSVELLPDSQDLIAPAELIVCLKDEPKAYDQFYSLPKAHQHYFIRWIEQAKTDVTKAKRIAQTVSALSLGMGYSEMMRAGKKDLLNG